MCENTALQQYFSDTVNIVFFDNNIDFRLTQIMLKFTNTEKE